MGAVAFGGISHIVSAGALVSGPVLVPTQRILYKTLGDSVGIVLPL